ncbi:hypothetical protein B0H17DRAFT_1129861 [Mycena rosella]|uniref:Uncharacterized protein n=1 Tax=Mycena rosella TaxID=1033263 RepID=A0AAD7GMT5_MYCRO|nr:hypothetical protein B0H17DRAFT_1129861 [Mycena rosella]
MYKGSISPAFISLISPGILGFKPFKLPLQHSGTAGVPKTRMLPVFRPSGQHMLPQFLAYAMIVDETPPASGYYQSLDAVPSSEQFSSGQHSKNGQNGVVDHRLEDNAADGIDTA